MSKLKKKGCTHYWVEMHHHQPNPNGGPDIHYCPTGFKTCANCYKTGLLKDPKCTRWGV